MTKANPPRSVTLLYSGGADSTVAASLLAERYDKIHLITFIHGAEIFADSCGRGLKTLLDHLGTDKFVHHYIDLGDLWMDMEIENMARFNFVCATCRLAMHTRAIIYNLEHNIHVLCDGALQEQSFNSEQKQGVVEEYRKLYKEYGIEYITPVWNYNRELEMRRLADVGIELGSRNLGWIPGVGGGHKKIQPFCVFSTFGSLFAINPYSYLRHQDDQVVEHIKGALDMSRNQIQSYFAHCGGRGVNDLINIDELGRYKEELIKNKRYWSRIERELRERSDSQYQSVLAEEFGQKESILKFIFMLLIEGGLGIIYSTGKGLFDSKWRRLAKGELKFFLNV